VRVVVLVALLTFGCASRTPGRLIGGALTVVGTGVLISTASHDCPESMSEPPSYPPVPPDLRPLGCGLGKAAGYSLGTLVAAVGVTALVVNESVGRHLPALHAAPTPSTDESPELQQLVINAGVAARAGRCKSVAAIADRIEALDSAFRHDGFLRDPAIAACVD